MHVFSNSHTHCLIVHCIKLQFKLFQRNSNFPLRACFYPPSNLLKAHGLQQSYGCPWSRIALLHRVQMPWQSPSFSVDRSAYVTCQDAKPKNPLSFSWISTELLTCTHSFSRSLFLLSLPPFPSDGQQQVVPQIFQLTVRMPGSYVTSIWGQHINPVGKCGPKISLGLKEMLICKDKFWSITGAKITSDELVWAIILKCSYKKNV